MAATLGLCVGVSGLEHGFFEALQGDVPTPGVFVHAIGPDQQLWAYGTEDAFTLVPSFLATGILAMVVGLLTIAWSVGFIDRPWGRRILVALGVALFSVGGGVAMILLVALGWLMAGRIGRPRRSPPLVPSGVAQVLARVWPALVALGFVLYACALWIAITGLVPGVAAPEHVLVVCWAALVAMVLAFGAAFVGTRIPVADDASLGDVQTASPIRLA